MKYQAAVTAPHFLATEAGEKILAKGGNAVEACIAVASTLTVVYPHMTSLGGDGFWLIHWPGEDPVALNAAGMTAKDLTGIEFGQHLRGPKVATTTAGAVSGWQAALERFEGELSLTDIFMPAINSAEQGFRVSETLHAAMAKLAEEYPHKDLLKIFFNKGQPYQVGDTITLPELARTYRTLADKGLDDWYCGELAQESAEYLKSQGSAITLDDIANTNAKWCEPLSVSTQWGTFFNLGSPTQGGASLNILGLLDELIKSSDQPVEFWTSDEGEEFALHYIVEAVKEAFVWRNANLSDAAECDSLMQVRLTPEQLKAQFQSISATATPWPTPGPVGDTVWMSVVDSNGLAVSYIQSLYWEFGSGVVNPNTGVVWNNRSLGFNLDPNHPNAIGPQRRPMHTLNPPLALLKDGSRLIYGTMGGEGQPQTQAAIIWRFLIQQMTLADSISAPRWLLGKTWGKAEDNLKIGASLFERVGERMLARGHDAVEAPDLAEFFGHAGAIHVSEQRTVAATDPRSDGKAIVLKKNKDVQT